MQFRFSHYDGSKVKKYKVSPNEPSSEISREVVVRTVEALMYKPIDIVIGNNVFDSSVMKAVVNQAHLAKASVFDFEKDEVVLPDKVNAVPRKRSREEFISCLGRAKPSIYEIKKSDFQRISDAIVM